MGKTLITTQQTKGTTGGSQGFCVGRIKVTENTRQTRGTLWECGVLGGEGRLYNLKNYLNGGFVPLLGEWLRPHTPLFLISLF